MMKISWVSEGSFKYMVHAIWVLAALIFIMDIVNIAESEMYTNGRGIVLAFVASVTAIIGTFIGNAKTNQYLPIMSAVFIMLNMYMSVYPVLLSSDWLRIITHYPEIPDFAICWIVEIVFMLFLSLISILHTMFMTCCLWKAAPVDEINSTSA